jgi:hypothetical protein
MAWLPTVYDFEILIEGDAQTDSFASKQPCPHCGRPYRTRSGMLVHINKKHKGFKIDGDI